jgi:hypothetical protein
MDSKQKKQSQEAGKGFANVKRHMAESSNYCVFHNGDD